MSLGDWLYFSYQRENYDLRCVVLLGQHAFWHSSAHILGEAMERHYGADLCYGPPIEEGFYYDMYLEGR